MRCDREGCAQLDPATLVGESRQPGSIAGSSDDDVWVTGRPHVLHRDGHVWSEPGQPADHGHGDAFVSVAADGKAHQSYGNCVVGAGPVCLAVWRGGRWECTLSHTPVGSQRLWLLRQGSYEQREPAGGLLHRPRDTAWAAHPLPRAIIGPHGWWTSAWPTTDATVVSVQSSVDLGVSRLVEYSPR